MVGNLRTKYVLYIVALATVLVAGCYTINLHSKRPVCDLNIKATHKCLFILEITEKIDKEGSKGWVFGRVPEEVIVHNAEHSARTNLGGAIGYDLSAKKIRRFEYKIEVEGLDRIEERVAYKFESVPGQTYLRWVGSARYPEDYPKDHPKEYQHREESRIPGSQLYASHSKPCCMCSTCKSDCVCPGEGGCPWCAVPDVDTLVARVFLKNGPFNIRVSHSYAPQGAPETFFVFLSGGKPEGNIFITSVARYKYDPQFATACMMNNA